MLTGNLYIHLNEVGVRHVVRITRDPSPPDVLVGVQFIGSRKTLQVKRAQLTLAQVPEQRRL